MARKNGQKKSRAKKAASLTAGLPTKLTKMLSADPHCVLTALQLADHCARNGLEVRIPEFLTPLENDYPFDNEAQSWQYNRLLAYGHVAMGQFYKAEESLARSLKAGDNSADAWYVLSILKLSMKEYAEAIEATRKYQAAIDRMPDDAELSDFSVTTSHASRLNDIAGQAYARLGRHEAAIDSYQRAIGLDPDSPRAYLNLATLLCHQNRRGEARQIIRQGLDHCQQDQELRLVLKSLEDRPTISACMIVKNEEELLPDCLDSIRDWVDEIVLVDTGSSDRTIEIAGEYGARIFHQKWANDFSKHRNYSIDQATGDWIFIIDADERILADDVPLILECIKEDKYSILSLNVFNIYGANEDRVTYSNSVRFFKRALDLRYNGIVHNDLMLPKDETVLRTRVRLKHLGYDLSPEKMRQKFNRTISLIKQQLTDKPDNVFALFNKAELLRGVDPILKPENAHEIIEAASRVVELTQPSGASDSHLHLMCLNHLAVAQLSLNEHDAALKYCQAALAIKPDYLDALMYAGFIHHARQEYPEAIQKFNQYLEEQQRFDGATEQAPVIMSYPASRDLAYSNLGNLHELIGDRRSAARCYDKSLKINPKHAETASFRGMLHLVEGDDAKAAELFSLQLENGRDTVTALLGLVAIRTRNNQIAEAEQFLQRAAESFPQNVRVFVEFGKFLAMTGNEASAANKFSTALVLADASGEIEAELAEHCFERKQFEQAATYYRASLDKRGPTSTLYNDLGNCYYKINDYPLAEANYRQALDLQPDLQLARRNLGLSQVQQGKAREAVATLEPYLESNRGETGISLIMADQYLLVKECELAVKYYELVLRAEPTNVPALFGLSEVYRIMGQQDAALLGFQRLAAIAPDFEPAQERVRQLSDSVQPG